MKRVIAIVLVLILALTCLAACSETKEGKCELCQKEETLYKVTNEGAEAWLCKTCKDGLEALADAMEAAK
ncbi:MAG: hypothetical protein IJC46_07035 [Clostridia bacterium]|nr:hypothetical protein [Clostridia bacterium]